MTNAEFPAWREEPAGADRESVGKLTAATGFFRPDEVAVAVELVEERLEKGAASGYYFCFADNADGSLAGYVCYGPIPCTIGSYDLYWIAVANQLQGRGLGKALMRKAETAAKAGGGRKMYVETSGKAQYRATREFYASCGYEVAARFEDFYDLGDDKLVFLKNL